MNTIDKFLGIIFFYTITTFNWDKYKKEGFILYPYVNEKASRYLNQTFDVEKWNMYVTLIEHIEPYQKIDQIKLTTIEELINFFDDMFGVENLDFSYFREVFIDSNLIHSENLQTLFNKIPDYMEILSSNFGISITLSRKLMKMEYERKYIERLFKFKMIGV